MGLFVLDVDVRVGICRDVNCLIVDERDVDVCGKCKDGFGFKAGYCRFDD